MKKRNLKTLSIGALLASSFVLTPIVNAEEQVNNQSIDAINQEITALEEASAALNAEINSLNNAVAENQELVSVHKNELEASKEQLAELEAEIIELEKVIEKRKEVLAEQARLIQVQGPLKNINYILEAESLSQGLNRIQIVADVTQAANENLNIQKADEEALQEKQAEVEKVKAEQEVLVAELENQTIELTAAKEQ